MKLKMISQEVLILQIYRTAYTGSLYRILQSNDHELELQTIEEIAQNDFTFYMVASYDNLTQHSVPMRGR